MELRHDIIRIEDEAETALVARQVNDELLRIWIICLTVVLEVGFSEERLLRLAVARFAHGGFEPGGHAFERRVLHRCWLNAAAVKRKSRDGGSRRRKRRRWCPHGFRFLWQVTKHALRDGLRRVAEEADAGKAYEAQLEALKAQHEADRAEAVKEREASRAAYFVELEQASKKVEALEAKLIQADQALKDAQEREASLDEAVASQVDAEILKAENARLTEALAARDGDDSARCAELEELVRSAGAERDEALQKLAANDADAGARLADAMKERDEALAAAAFAKTTAERQAADLAAASEQREALSQQCETDRTSILKAPTLIFRRTKAAPKR